MKKIHTPTPKGTRPKSPRKDKTKRLKSKKVKIVRTKIDIISNIISKKVFSGVPLSPQDEFFLKELKDKFRKDNKDFMKNNWNIKLASFSDFYNDSNYFKYKAEMKKTKNFDWIATAIAEAHIDSFFRQKDSVVTLFKSKSMHIEVDIDSLVVFLKDFEDKKVYTKAYSLEDLPLFKNTIETMK